MGGVGPLAVARHAVVGRHNALPMGQALRLTRCGERRVRVRAPNGLAVAEDGLDQGVPGGIYVQVTTANAGWAGTPVMAAMALGQGAG